jgi:hypothetical protein
MVLGSILQPTRGGGASNPRRVHSRRPWTTATGARERGEWPGEGITAGERENGQHAGFLGLARGENGHGHRDPATTGKLPQEDRPSGDEEEIRQQRGSVLS